MFSGLELRTKTKIPVDVDMTDYEVARETSQVNGYT